MLLAKISEKISKFAFEVASFPAIKLGKQTFRQVIWRFADELTLITISLGLLVLGHMALAGGVFDNSPLARALLKFPDENPALYQRILSSSEDSTTKHLVSFAQAEETLSTPEKTDDTLSDVQVTYIDEQGLHAPIPDSWQLLLNAQIQVYETKSNDTLQSIADKRGISVNTIKWANNLKSSNSIQAGWYLVLPSTDGVLVQTDENTSIAEIARKFSGDPERILSYNGLPNPDAFTPGQYLMCPGCSIPSSVTSTAERKIGIRYKDIPDEAGSTHVFYAGHCTWYVAKKFKVTFGGSARYWIDNALAAGYEISDTPVNGAVAVTSDRPPYGHVAYVESVDFDKGTVRISEMNYKGLFILSERELPIHGSGIVGYILPKP